MSDREFFQTLDPHRPNWPLINYPKRKLFAADADLRRRSFDNANLSTVIAWLRFLRLQYA